MRTRIVNKRGVIVIESVDGEEMRHDICLCWECERMVTEEMARRVLSPGGSADWQQQRADELARAFNCPTAQANYENCQRGEVAAPITRCPLFLQKEE